MDKVRSDRVIRLAEIFAARKLTHALMLRVGARRDNSEKSRQTGEVKLAIAIMSDPQTIIETAIANARETIASIAQLRSGIARAAEMISASLLSGGKILACGNGGSAADAADFTTEYACRFLGERRPFPALNLSMGGSLVTATGNDYGFDDVFARQVQAFGEEGDVLVAISTSGKSANIRRALEIARERKLHTIALLGRDGGTCARLAEIDLIVPGTETARIQEAHKFILHVICQIVEPSLVAAPA